MTPVRSQTASELGASVAMLHQVQYTSSSWGVVLCLTPNWGSIDHLESQGSEENELLRLGAYAQHAMAHRAIYNSVVVSMALPAWQNRYT